MVDEPDWRKGQGAYRQEEGSFQEAFWDTEVSLRIIKKQLAKAADKRLSIFCEAVRRWTLRSGYIFLAKTVFRPPGIKKNRGDEGGFFQGAIRESLLQKKERGRNLPRPGVLHVWTIDLNILQSSVTSINDFDVSVCKKASSSMLLKTFNRQ